MVLMTAEVGGGKSTALRFAVSRLHPSEYRLLWVTARGVEPGTLSPDHLGTESENDQSQPGHFNPEDP